MDTIAPDSVDQFIQLSGPLFRAVQQSGIFSDSKTFVDSIPSTPPEEIRQEFSKHKNDPGFDLEAFVRNHFDLPKEKKADQIQQNDSMYEHIDQLWNQLSRQPNKETQKHSTLLPLPHPYIVPGGRFREIYYWDTYFTSVGLAAAGHLEMVENLARNFSWLIQRVGHVPNGNRYYYVSRSQPPFLVFLVDLIAQYKSEKAVQEYLPALQQEYAFWMNGKAKLPEGAAHRRIVSINGSTLNRYWDDRPLPREESWREDCTLAKDLSPEEAALCYRNLRAGAESGWDFSSRWFADGQSLNTIHTTNILPVDLNALLYFLETKLGQWIEGSNNLYARAAEKRSKSFDNLFWNASMGYYFDYNWKEQQQTDTWSMAGAYPLFVRLASEQQADSVAHILEKEFLKDGGLVSTLHDTGQQWDYPNGWAPLQWIAVQGLKNYGHRELAETIARRWLALNESVFKRTGKMMEKYNVCDLSLEAGGGEYPLQDGFGWTNGVAVALKNFIN